MRHGEYVSYSELAGRCGVAVSTISSIVAAEGLPWERLPHSARGKRVSPASARRVEAVCRERKIGKFREAGPAAA